MTAHWISCRLFTVQVTTDENSVIVWAAPIVRKFTGQPLDHLLRWARKQGGPLHTTSWPATARALAANSEKQ